MKQQWEEFVSVWTDRLTGRAVLLQTITLKSNVCNYLLVDAQLDEVAYKAEYNKKSPDWKYSGQKSSVTPTVGGWKAELSSCIS